MKTKKRSKKDQEVIQLAFSEGISLTTAELYYYAARNPEIVKIKEEYDVGWSKAREIYYKQLKEKKSA